MYYVLQFATLLILVLAANTSFSGFPWLSSILAHDGFLPTILGSWRQTGVHHWHHRPQLLSTSLMVIFHGNTWR